MKHFFLNLSALCLSVCVQAQLLPELDPLTPQGSHTTVALRSQSDSFTPGAVVRIGVVMRMDPHWHTYWLNPGDSGMPTQIGWTLPEGFEAGEIRWPVPDSYDVGGLISLGYEGEAVLVVPIKTSENAVIGETYTFEAAVSWLECKEACIPGDATVSITLTATDAPGQPNEGFDEAMAKLPQPESLTAVWQEDSGSVVLEVPVEGDRTAVDYFPVEEGVWQLLPAPRVVSGDGQVQVTLIPAGDETPRDLRGLLRFEDGTGVWIDASPAGGQEVSGAEVTDPVEAEEGARGLAYYLMMSFIAGVAMNLLPCIFPVLGLKISSFVEQAQGGKGSVRTHALVFGAGVLVSMWVLAAGVSVLGGAWGAQFQDPTLVIGMLLVITFFTMNLFGVFEMGLALTTVGGGLSDKPGYAGSFFQGILLTVVGTPCTGPLLVVVMAWMLAQPLWVVFLVFTLLGLGLSSPYVIFAFSPPLLDRLPPPGNWMITFKKASAFALVGFLWVLIYVLKGLIPIDGTVRVLGAMILVCLAAWILGTWNTFSRSVRTRWIAKVVVLVVLVTSGWIAYSYKVPVASLTPELEAKVEAGQPIRWSDVTPEVAGELIARGVPVHYQPWSPERVKALQASGTPVFVDFTADWCTICKLNKLKALHKPEVMKDFADKGVVTLRADWTGRDETIAGVLESFGRRGVPVYLLYDGSGGDPELLPESLSPEILAEALDKLSL